LVRLRVKKPLQLPVLLLGLLLLGLLKYLLLLFLVAQAAAATMVGKVENLGILIITLLRPAVLIPL
jgi:hypothetical protein